MAPIVHGLESEWESRVEFLFVNVADSTTAAARARLGFDATPHFFFLSATGEVKGDLQGVMPRDTLVARLTALTAEPARNAAVPQR